MTDTSSTAKPTGKMNNAFDPDAALALPCHVRDLVARRAELLGPAYRLFYEEPIHVVRGEGCRLWDSEGNEYLDAYNNVVSVGHAHPRVVEAVAQQMSLLCTHTRYLHEDILEYAAGLRESFGRTLGTGHIMLTCTGSEANDLALRIAKYKTGQNGVIVTSEAYHGNSDQTASISPALGANSRLGTWVRQVPAPDSYRIPSGELAPVFAAGVAAQIEELERHGTGLAAVIVDTLFTSDGIYAEPTDLLDAVAEVAHRAGGLLIADEVQAGFARSGERMWGYQRHGVDPDIVTLGKPMGNGFPVAGIAVARDVVADFGHDMRYFNTFGGNPVAVAAAQATWNVIRDEKLLDNAFDVGQMLHRGLKELMERYACIGDVRGSGLYVGVELVVERESKRADGVTAIKVVNALRRRGVLISATGPAGNVLKIRPPLVFSPNDVDRVLTGLTRSLDEVQHGLPSD